MSLQVSNNRIRQLAVKAELTLASGIVFGAVVAIGAARISAGKELFRPGPWRETRR